jgi:6-phosphogluconolactonase
MQALVRPIGRRRLAGRSPREIAITPNGCLLLAASQDDDLVEVFTIHQHDGTLNPVARR